MSQTARKVLKSAAHTPGPWEARRALQPSDGGWDWGIGAQLGGENDPKSYCIAEAFEVVSPQHRVPVAANARLIAAAPDMLTALQIIADWDKAPLTGEHAGALIDVIRSICDRARVEIAKATGAVS